MKNIKIEDLRKKGMTKKALREYYNAQRGSWNGVNPVTRTANTDKRRQGRAAEKQALIREMQ